MAGLDRGVVRGEQQLERAVDGHVDGPAAEVGEHEMVAAAHLQPAGVLVVVGRGLAGADRAAGGEQAARRGRAAPRARPCA